MNTTASVVKIICWTLVALLLIAVLVIGIMFGSISNFFGVVTRGAINSGLSGASSNSTVYSSGYNDAGTYTVNPSGITKISVDWVSAYVKVTPYDGTDISFTEKSNLPLSANETLRYHVSGDTLHIEYCDTIFRSINKSKSLDILVPNDLALSLNELDIDSVSGYVEVSNMTVNDLETSTVSGRITIDSVIATEEIECDTTSGEMTILDCTAPKLKTESVSGSTNAKGEFREINSSTVSGSLEVSDSICPDTVKFSSISGSSRLNIPETSNFTLSLDKVSGSINSDFPMTLTGDNYVAGTGASRFSISTVSGSVTIGVSALS